MSEPTPVNVAQEQPRPTWGDVVERIQFDEWRSNNSRDGRQANKGGRFGDCLAVGQGDVNIKQFYGIAAGVFVLGLLIGLLVHKSSR